MRTIAAVMWLLGLSAPCAWADSGYGAVKDERPLTPDYSKLYYLGYDVSTSSSPCIGNPITAECAYDTYYACQEWWDEKLCQMMGRKMPDVSPDKYSSYSMSKHTMEIYKFLSKRQLTDEDIPEQYRGIWQAGDTVIFTATQICRRYDHCYTALKDRDDPKGKCQPLDCNAAGYTLHSNAKHSADIVILRQEKDHKWSVKGYYIAATLDEMKDRPEKLYQEGLSQSPW